MSTSIAEFHPAFQWAVNQTLAECGGASVGSGFRTIEEQRALLYKREQGILVADPGTSRHEGNSYGAVDMEGDLECFAAVGARYGLTNQDVPGEPWHFQFTDEAVAAIEAGTYEFGEVAGEAAPAEEAQTLGDRWNGMVFGRQPEDVGEVVDARAARTAAVGSEAAQVKSKDAGAAFTPEASAGFTAGGGAMDPVEVARVLASAGFKGDALVTALAIAFGESGLDSGAEGDTSITGGGWGPSVGLMQIRSHSEGGWREQSQLYDPAFNARAAFAISNGGTNFKPWTVWNEGIFEKYVSQAKAAVAALGGESTFVPESSSGLASRRDWSDGEDDALLVGPVPDADAGMIGALTEDMGAGLLNRIGSKFKKSKPDTGVSRTEEMA